MGRCLFTWSALPILLAGVGLTLGGVACGDIPGMTEGGACNAQGVCGPGLRCVQDVCHAEGSAAVGSWQRMEVKDVANVAETDTFDALAGRSASDLYAAGSGGVYHFDGQRWTQLLDDSMSFAHVDDTDVFVGNSATLYRRYGETWTQEVFKDEGEERTSTHIIALARLSDGLFAVRRSYSDGAIYRYNGSEWALEATLQISPEVARGVRGPDGIVLAPNGQNLLYLWTVGATTMQSIPLPGAQSRTFEALAGNSMDELLVLGKSFALQADDSGKGGFSDLVASFGAYGERSYYAAYRGANGTIWLGGQTIGQRGGIESCDGVCGFDAMDQAAAVRTFWGDAQGPLFAAGNQGGIWRLLR